MIFPDFFSFPFIPCYKKEGMWNGCRDGHLWLLQRADCMFKIQSGLGQIVIFTVQHMCDAEHNTVAESRQEESQADQT